MEESTIANFGFLDSVGKLTTCAGFMSLIAYYKTGWLPKTTTIDLW